MALSVGSLPGDGSNVGVVCVVGLGQRVEEMAAIFLYDMLPLHVMELEILRKK